MKLRFKSDTNKFLNLSELVFVKTLTKSFGFEYKLSSHPYMAQSTQVDDSPVIKFPDFSRYFPQRH